jgi:pimeloyl-ACP methyl ester carboxylesterase
VLNTLRLNRIALSGSSLGAVSAVAFALDYSENVSRLALISPGLIGLDLNQDPKLAAYQAYAWDKNAELVVKAWVDGPKRSPADVNAVVLQKALAMVTENVTKRKPGDRSGFRMEPTQAQRLNKLTMSVRVSSGGSIWPISRLTWKSIAVQGAAVTTLGNAAHLINIEDSKAFNKVLAEFLSE